MELILISAAAVVVAGLAGYLFGRSQLQSQCAVLRTRLEHERRVADERIHDEDRLLATVERVSKVTLHEASEQMVKNAEASLRLANLSAKGELDQQRLSIAHLIAPVQENLARLEAHVNETEKTRRQEYGGLFQQMQTVAETSLQVQAEAAQLKNVLKSSTSQRGRWGEVQLRRVVELAGMAEHCDFTEQPSVTNHDNKTSRADLVVFLPGDMKIAIDAKVPFDAYERACTTDDPVAHKKFLADHTKHLRAHVDELAKRAYWNEYTPSCGFTVLFVPGEALLDAALATDPDLWEHANSRQILLATPTTLIALLRMAAVGWLQQEQSANAAEIIKLGKELYGRVAKLGDHIEKLGKGLKGAVASYNDFVGSLETRVLPSARRLSELGVADSHLSDLSHITETPRTIHHEVLLAAIESENPLEITEEARESA